MNYGLLGLATNVYNKGYKNVKMFQGDFKTIETILHEIEMCKIDLRKLKYPVFISIPSFLQ